MRINPFPLMSLILLVILTLVLAILTVVKSNQVRAYQEGDPDDSSFRSNAKLREEVNQLQARITAANDALALRGREVNRLDLELSKNRILASGDVTLAAVGLPPSDDLKGNPLAEVAGAKDTTWKFTSDLVSASVRRLEALKGKLESRDFQDNPQLDEAVRKRQTELQDITKRISDDEASFAKDREELTKRLDDLASSKDKSDKQRREDFSRRATGVAKLEDDIRKLLELELKWMTEIDADGQIVETAANEVVINLGAKEKAFPGLIFAVFNHEKGRYVPKGTVETIEVRPDISICRIISQNDPKLYPIGRGDSVGNPVFDAKQPKVFFVAGEFKHYNKEDIEQFIRSTGGIVSSTLGPNCDFLVAGDRSEREQASARQFQILAMSEDTLLGFVQKTFAPKK